MRERMGPGGGNLQPAMAGHGGKLAPQADDLGPRIVDVAADVGPEFDDRLVHLRLDLLVQCHRAGAENLLNVRTQFARLRIDDLEFLLDPEGEDVISRAHVPQQPPTLVTTQAGEQRRFPWVGRGSGRGLFRTRMARKLLITTKPPKDAALPAPPSRLHSP